MRKSKAGKNPQYESVDEIHALVLHYFDECKGEVLRDAVGEPMLDRHAQPIIVGAKAPTVAGLALALGFKTTKQLKNYEPKKREYKEAVEYAWTELEKATEELLFDRDASNGARFTLMNHFGWQYNAEQEAKTPVVNIIGDIPKRKRGQELKKPAAQNDDGSVVVLTPGGASG